MPEHEMSDANRTELQRELFRAADHLRVAAEKLEAYGTQLGLEPVYVDALLNVLHDVGVSRWSADACIAHASHRFGMAILWQEREGVPFG